MRTLFRIFLVAAFNLMNIDALNAQWIQRNSGTSAMLSDVVMLNTVTAIAVGKNGSILETTNAGETWVDVSLPLSYGGYWNAISFFDSVNGVIVGDNSVVFTTPNGGKSWLWHYIPGGQKCLSALCIGPGSIYVGADSGWVYNTSDAGRTWTAEKISTRPIRSLFRYRGPTIIGVSQYALTPYSLCTQYVIPPPSWGEQILPNFGGLGSAAYDAEFCNGGGAGFIVGVQGDLRSAPTILRKSMSDTSWREVSTGFLRDGTLLGVSAPSANVVYVCGSNGMIYKSPNGGDTWLDQTVQKTRNVNAIFFYDEKHGFAVGDSGLIFYTSNGGLTGVGDRENFPPAKYVLEQNYPNPFNPSTTVSYTLPKTASVSLRIFNALGQEVASLIDERKEAGYYQVTWNANVPSGIYFYRLQARQIDGGQARPTDGGQAGEYVETKKMILLR